MKKVFFIVILLLSICNVSQAQSFNASVNRNVVPEGETFVLTLELKDDDTTSTPDLSVLNRDFTVLGISNGYRTNIVNSQVSKSRQWNLVMIPKKNGEIIIPEIALSGYKSNPITITVTSAGEEAQLTLADTNSQKFKISGKISKENPYVQEQINYRLKIYDTGGLQGTPPIFNINNDEWIVKLLGDPDIETKIINGKNLREITFNYALFPQKSGTLTIPPVQFNGYYLTKRTRNDPFAGFFEDDEFFAGFGLNTVFAEKNPVILTTKPITVNVKPAISGSKWWLPAKDVKLWAEFNDAPSSFKVGEPVSRTIYIKATGVLDTNLPEIEFTSQEGVKQYPEKPITEMKAQGNNIISVSKISTVYIPSKVGEITFPKIELKWYNIATEKFETATIPEYKINVDGIVNTADDVEDIKKTPVLQTTKEAQSTPEVINKVDNSKVIYLLIAAFFCGIFATMLISKIINQVSLRPNNKKTIVNAAKSKDLKTLRDELILWGQYHFPHNRIANLQDVADIFDSPIFNRELDKIRETLYAQSEKEWDDKAFLEVFCQMCKSVKKQTKKNQDPLPKLYK